MTLAPALALALALALAPALALALALALAPALALALAPALALALALALTLTCSGARDEKSGTAPRNAAVACVSSTLEPHNTSRKVARSRAHSVPPRVQRTVAARLG